VGVSFVAESPVQGTTEQRADPQGKRVDTSFGFSLLVELGDYSSALILRDGVFEIPETDLVTRLVRPSDTCIDGGCHLGYYTCLMAKLAGPNGRVYAFDANPWCCQRTKWNLALNGLESAEVIHAALGDERGTTMFHVSTDDQTGLSSLGPIEHQKEVISVPWLRLEDFLNQRDVQRVRLLKLDVEGAEKLVLLGLGKVLTDHCVDFVLLECYDERLQLLKCSTEDVAKLLDDAGYVPWEYGTENPSGWSRASRVQSRGDCNYLFASPLVTEPIPQVSLAGAMRLVSRQIEQQQSDLDWLNDALRDREQTVTRLEAILHSIENSRGWRLLNVLKKVRDFVRQRTRTR
jgi:FkbM family methyltransferase